MQMRDARLDPLVVDAVSSDVAGIAAVHLATRQSAYRTLLPDQVLADMSTDRMTRWWRSRLGSAPQPHRMLVAIDGLASRKVLGFAHVGAGEEDGLGELHAVHVHPTAQGHGLGKRLMINAMRALLVFGFSRARLWVLDGNENAQQFYRLQGWQQVVGKVREDNIDGAAVTELAYDRNLSV